MRKEVRLNSIKTNIKSHSFMSQRGAICGKIKTPKGLYGSVPIAFPGCNSHTFSFGIALLIPYFTQVIYVPIFFNFSLMYWTLSLYSQLYIACSWAHCLAFQAFFLILCQSFLQTTNLVPKINTTCMKPKSNTSENVSELSSLLIVGVMG